MATRYCRAMQVITNFHHRHKIIIDFNNLGPNAGDRR